MKKLKKDEDPGEGDEQKSEIGEESDSDSIKSDQYAQKHKDVNENYFVNDLNQL